MNIIFAPWDHGNPYQRQLADALEKICHTVVPCDTRRIFSLMVFLLKNGRPDIFHVHWPDHFMVRRSAMTTFLASMLFVMEVALMRLLGVRIVWTVHNIISHDRKYTRIEKTFHQILLGLYDKIIHLSHSSIAIMHNFYRISDKTRRKFHVVPHGHYVRWYKNSISRETARSLLEINEDAKVLLCFGVIRPYKGVHILFDALQGIPDRNLHVLIAGSPKNKEIENQLYLYCHRDERIEVFLHFIPDYDVQIFMNAADIVVLPYSDILNSGVAILAMSFGKPVIAPDTGGIPELVDDNGGVLFEPNDRESLVQAIRRALSLDHQAMGRHNQEKISRLDWGTIASMTADVYAGKKEAYRA